MTLNDLMSKFYTKQHSGPAITSVTLSLNAGVAYANGDLLADTQVVANAIRENDGYGKLIAAVVLDKDDQGQALDLVFLNYNASMGTENSTPTLSDANAEYVLGTVSVASADFTDLTLNRVAVKGGLNVPLVAASGTRNIYIAAISRGTGTYTASGIVVKLFIE